MPIDFTSELAANPLAAIPICFLAGVLTSFTPCVYPMIPITAAIVGGQTPGVRDDPAATPRSRALLLTSLYVLGVALVYSALGLFAGLSGTLFGTVSSNPWLYLVMANVLILAALALMDVLPIRLPASVMQRAVTTGTAGRASGAFAMGAMSGLVAAPCSAPVMAAVLTWVATTRSGVLGFSYLFAFSLGMCTLLVVVGLSAGTISRLPRAGAWMVTVKKAFAFVMIGVAEYYLIKAGQGFL